MRFQGLIYKGKMNIELIGLLAAILTLILALAGMYLAIKSEFRKSSEKMFSAKIADEKRHSVNERRIAILEERMNLSDTNIQFRLDEISTRIAGYSRMLINHIGDKHK